MPIAKGRLKELLAEEGLRLEWSGAVDKTQTHRPLVNIYRSNGEEVGKRCSGGPSHEMESEASKRLVRRIAVRIIMAAIL
ncbi:hypothetical protein [Rhizobium lentis]|uniref:Uncharacterized protein n=1 Tax=Rhizobium lentis TaxID=1138194 RepID=A0A7W8XKQ8_9HYPH|nr:hypothetical protein [Rhizobium lentis]MBB4577422.1 hypothetical protein [Rhizobium lentis]MBB5554029.1 hypothetical protein [Rhizobium lentis]MBB5564611.1 hypothetical protein [Rhizobium lentis]MBB5571141.1 hypothetical protein [Rhizobium lentis]